MGAGNIRKSFDRVKEDINMLRNVQASFAGTVKNRLDINRDESAEAIENSTVKLQEKLDSSVRFLKDSIRSQTQDIESEISRQASQLLEKIGEISEVAVAARDENQLMHKNLNNLAAKFEELENLSMDAEDLEKTFVQRQELNKLTPFRDFRKLRKKVESLASSIYDMTEKRQGFATIEQFRHLEDSIIGLKDNLVFRKDIEQISNRIDVVESKFINKIDKIHKNSNAIVNEMAKIYALKRDFVSKEQHKNMRKEIRLLVQGLKDVQKLKNQVKKLKKA